MEQKDAFPVKEQKEMMGDFLLETMQIRKENIFPAWKGKKAKSNCQLRIFAHYKCLSEQQ